MYNITNTHTATFTWNKAQVASLQSEGILGNSSNVHQAGGASLAGASSALTRGKSLLQELSLSPLLLTVEPLTYRLLPQIPWLFSLFCLNLTSSFFFLPILLTKSNPNPIPVTGLRVMGEYEPLYFGRSRDLKILYLIRRVVFYAGITV